MKQWYILHTRPNAEYQVAASLRQRQMQVYLPELVEKNRGGERRPFFPCYLFIKIDLKTTSASSVQWTPGLRRIIAFDNQPAPLPEEVIELIQARLAEIEAAGGWSGNDFRPGEPVRITGGPFRDMVAIFDRPAGPARRVQVLLNILGRVSRLQLKAGCLEKAPAGADTPLKQPRRTRGRGRPIH